MPPNPTRAGVPTLRAVSSSLILVPILARSAHHTISILASPVFLEGGVSEGAPYTYSEVNKKKSQKGLSGLRL